MSAHTKEENVITASEISIKVYNRYRCANSCYRKEKEVYYKSL